MRERVCVKWSTPHFPGSLHYHCEEGYKKEQIPRLSLVLFLKSAKTVDSESVGQDLLAVCYPSTRIFQRGNILSSASMFQINSAETANKMTTTSFLYNLRRNISLLSLNLLTSFFFWQQLSLTITTTTTFNKHLKLRSLRSDINGEVSSHCNKPIFGTLFAGTVWYHLLPPVPHMVHLNVQYVPPQLMPILQL